MGIRKYATDDDKPYSQNARCLSRRQWRELQDAFGNACAYCGTTNFALIPEHYEPLSRGGRDVPENIVPSCRSCNSSKIDLFVLEWFMVQCGALRRISYAQRYKDKGYTVLTTRNAPRVCLA